MIYTLGTTEFYEKGFEDAKEKGIQFRKKGRREDYCGGSVWETREEVEEYIKANNCPWYSVYGVNAEWVKDTAPSKFDKGFRDLLIDAELIQLED